MSLSGQRERPCPSCGPAGTFCDHRRWKDRKLPKRQLSIQLSDLHTTEMTQWSHNHPRLSPGSHLLEKLVDRDNLMTLQIHLYRVGYLIRIPGRTGSSKKVPYDHSFLESLDHSMIPFKLAKILDEAGLSSLFYNGRLPVSFHNHFGEPTVVSYSLLESDNILLAGTSSILGKDLGAHEQLKLESRMLSSSVEPICLDPDVDVAVIDNWSQYHQKLFTPMRNRPTKRRSAERPPHSFDFISRLAAKRRRVKFDTRTNIKREPEEVKSLPSPVDLTKFFKKIPRFDPNAERTMRLTQEDVLETVGSGGHERTTKISIYQLPLNEQYFGNVVSQIGKHKAEHSFELGSYSNVHLYLNQFRELFTEEGRRAMKITHFVPGKLPIVRHTPGFNSLIRQESPIGDPPTPSSTAPTTPAPSASTMSPPQTPLPSQTPILAQHLSTPTMSPAPSLVSPLPSTSSNASGMSNFSINVVERLNFTNSQQPTVVQIVKNIQPNAGSNNKPQVFLQSANGAPIVVPGIANMQGIQVHPLGNIKHLQGKVLQQVGVVGQKMQMNGPNQSQFAVQLSPQMGKTIEVQQVGNGPPKQLQLLAPHMNGNGQIISNSMPHLSKVLTSNNMSSQAPQSIADHIAAQMRQKNGPRQVLIQPGQVANATQIHNLVQQISQQINAQKNQSGASIMGAISPNMTTVNSNHAPGQSGMVVGPTVLQMKPAQQVVLQPQQMMSGVINGGRLVGVSPALLGQQAITPKPQPIVLHNGIQLSDGTSSNTSIQGNLVQDNRTAMQILHAAVGTAHHATSMQLAAIQRQLHNQREKKS